MSFSLSFFVLEPKNINIWYNTDLLCDVIIRVIFIVMHQNLVECKKTH